jgi:4-amino-4-deoxy-L-arabinose transferase-like glycosyltransferase
MVRRMDNRAGHWLLLALMWSLLCLPCLGGPSLWDIDEGNNAGCAREMYESRDWVVPRFNNRIRYDKPVLLYWLQAAAYSTFGINEFSARLPSAVAALLTILVTYELGRSLFGRRAGLVAGLVLGSSVSFCASAHFANPDALLDLATALGLFCWWRDRAGGGTAWYIAASVAAGLGVLAKGLVGLVLPAAAVVLFVVWRRDWRRLLDRRLAWAVIAFLLVAAPWYVWVGIETKGQWLAEFWRQHHYERMTHALENHRGPVFYYLPVLLAGFAPWSIFLAPTAWLAWREARRRTDSPDQAPFQFLICWIAVYFLFFSWVSTKLPNYILPLYPAVAVLTGCLLERWRTGEMALPAWVIRASLVCLALLGLGAAVGLLAAGGVLRPAALHGRFLPGLGWCALLGAVWVLAAPAGAWLLHGGRRGGLIAVTALAAAAFAAGAAAWGPAVVDRCKAPRQLAQALPPDQAQRDLRIATYDYFQPSFVFYCRREIDRLSDVWKLLEFLGGPLPAYAVLPAQSWEDLCKIVPCPFRVVARRYDLYEGRDVVLVTNELVSPTR